MFYKAVDRNLCGMDGFQYEIGKIATANTDDPRNYLHFSDCLSRVVGYGPVILEIKPITEINTSNVRQSMNAKQILPVRIIPRDEEFRILREENNVLIYHLAKIKPTCQELLILKDQLRPMDMESICLDFNWLTADEKKQLLPKSWWNRIDEQEAERKLIHSLNMEVHTT